MLELIKGDLMKLERGVIVHQVNALNKMGAGIAGEIAKKYPKHLEDYNELAKKYPKEGDRMGRIVVTELGEVTIVGIVGQYGYGNSKRSGRCYTDYKALEEGLIRVGKLYNYTNKKIYLPEKIACELAGGDVGVVHGLIKEHIKNPVLVEYSKGLPIKKDNITMLIDGMNLIHRSHYANSHSETENGVHNGGVIGFIRYINRYISKFDVDDLIVCLDAGTDTFRKKIYPEYKATRSETPEELREQFPYIKEFMSLSKIKFIEDKNYEADDLIGTLAKNIKKDNKAIIVSGDGDLFQLVDDNIDMLYVNVKGDEIYTKKDVIEKYSGLTPSQLIDLKALMGDKGDNIPGVTGIGEKTGISLISEYGYLDNLYRNIEDIKGKRQENLINEKELAYLSYELGKIKTDIALDLGSLLSPNKVNTESKSVLEFMNKMEIAPNMVGVDLDKVKEEVEAQKRELKVLECSSKGNKDFSAFYAKVPVFGRVDSIENHYQLCKRFGSEIPKTWRDAKGKKPTHINIGGIDLDIKFLSQYYKLLWCKYLDARKDLVAVASQYDDYSDMFKGQSINCQADVVKQYIKEGRDSILNDCSELLEIMNSWTKVA